jgi:hypothetical protein
MTIIINDTINVISTTIDKLKSLLYN